MKSGSKLPKIPLMDLPKKAKLVLLGGGALVFVIILTLGYNLFLKKPENSQQLANVATQQARILQAAEMGVEKARGQTARNLAITTKLSLIDDQKALKDALGDKNVRVSTKDDPELEQKLIIAEQANRFDEELLTYLQTELTSYTRNIQTAYNTTEKTDKKLREILAAQHKNARFLAGQGAEEQ